MDNKVYTLIARQRMRPWILGCVLCCVLWVCVSSPSTPFPNSQLTSHPHNNVFLSIPFTSQAPYAQWTPLYNEACEEAAIIMAMRYVQHKGLRVMEADREINKLVDYQEKHYGGHFDLTVAKMAKLMKEFYGFDKFEVVQNASIDTIIKALSEKHPVIAPMAGRKLGNPYYKQPGPVYHMLVFKGYDLSRKEFIVNDSGTKRGLNYRYKFDVINNAWGDYGSKIKALIVFGD